MFWTTEDHTRQFWRDALAIRGSVTPRVSRRVLVFAGWAVLVTAVDALCVDINLHIEVAPYEVAGAALGLLLVLRTNAGYDRWWEARRLWGAITNDARNLVIAALAYGPDDPRWRDRLARLAAAFPHVVRHSLRGERVMPQVEALLGPEETREIAACEHMPGTVSLRIAELLREGCDRMGMDRLAFLQAERARSQWIDNLGGCERILKSPLPIAYAIIIRRFVVLFLATLPFALLPRIDWLTPLVTLLVAYPILALDDIGAELQNPFDVRNVGHLPIDAICATIEQNVRELVETGSRLAGGNGEGGHASPHAASRPRA
jgi:putative membrane protein